MVKINQYLFFLLFISLIGCRKDVDLFIPAPYTQQDIKSVLASSLHPLDEVVADFDPSITNVINIGSGFQIEIPANALIAANGQNFTCENVHFVYSPINTFASQLRDFQSSVEYQTQRILQTENSFVISITCDDTALLLKEGQNIRVRIPNISKTVDKALYESITLDDDLIKFWKRTGSTNSIEAAEWTFESTNYQGVTLLLDELGAFTIGQSIESDSQAKVDVCFDYPQNFATTNTVPFIYLKNSKSLVIVKGNEEYSMCVNNLPVGTSIKIGSISKVIENYFWDSYNNYVVPNISNATVKVTPNLTTKDEISGFISVFVE